MRTDFPTTILYIGIMAVAMRYRIEANKGAHIIKRREQQFDEASHHLSKSNINAATHRPVIKAADSRGR